MKICIVCHDHKLSGANMSLIDWLKDSINSNNEYIVVLPRYNREFIKKLNSFNIKVICGFYIPVHRQMFKTPLFLTLKNFIKKIYAALFNNISYLYLYFRIKKLNIDIIHSNSFSTVAGVKIARLLNVPHIWHIREFMEEDHQIKHYFPSKIKKYCSYSSAIFISDVIALKYLNLYKFKNYNIIYNKIEYDNSYKKDRKFMEDNICNLLIVGTLSENKGQLEAIKSIENINKKYNVKLYICGSGPEENYLKNYVQTKKLQNIVFLGYRKDVKEIRKNIDIALMCSKSEALGRVTIESQYYENLIIGANSGCTPYLIKNGFNGLLYEQGSSIDLQNKILYAINNKALCEKMVANAKETATEKYSKPIINKIEDMYNKIIKERV